jgi:hypothetical protein
MITFFSLAVASTVAWRVHRGVGGKHFFLTALAAAVTFMLVPAAVPTVLPCLPEPGPVSGALLGGLGVAMLVVGYVVFRRQRAAVEKFIGPPARESLKRRVGRLP